MGTKKRTKRATSRSQRAKPNKGRKPAKRSQRAQSAKRASRDGAHCSFCGKPENQVGRLLSGGGEQPVGLLPVVNICNECIALCNRILLDHPSKRHTPWTLFVTGGERYEWAGFAQDDGSTFMMVRRFNNDQKSFGLVLERGDQPSTELAKETVLKVPEYF
jgi:hypothetical protein